METKRFRDLCERFSPFAWLAADLLPHAVTAEHDAPHDIAHLSRVWSLSSKIALAEGGEMEILAAAVLLHDCVAIPKSSPHRRRHHVWQELKRIACLKREAGAQAAFHGSSTPSRRIAFQPGLSH